MRISAIGALTLAAAAAVVAVPTAANAADPVAVPDTAQVSFETAKVIDVLANDTSDPGTTKTLTTLTPTAAHGTVSCDEDGECVYTPNAGWRGADSFAYSFTAGGATASSTVTVETGISMISVSSTPANVVAVDDELKPELRNPTHTVTGTVTGSGGVPIAGVQVQLYSRTSVEVGTPKVAVAGGLVTSNDKGKISVPNLQPVRKTYYSWKSAAGKNSAERSVTVTPFLTTKWGDGTFAAGGTVSPAATAGPVTAGQDVVLQKKLSTGWTAVETKQFGTPAEDNSATVNFSTLSFPESGSFRYRVIVPQSDSLGRESATSGTKTLTVYDAEITSIQAVNSDEYVKIKNTGTVSLNLKGWRLKDNNSDIVLPKRAVAAGNTVKVHTGKGVNDSKNLYLKRTSFLWANSGTVQLWDNAGTPVLMDDITYPAS